MALYDASRPVVAKTGLGARFHNLMTRIAAALVEWNEQRVTRNALSRLSDHQLEDLGLTRADVDTLYRL